MGITRTVKVFIHLIVLFLTNVAKTNCTNFQWTPEGTWQRTLQQPGNAICVDIPSNMSLCHGIGYTKMRLPNLLHHDSLQEVSQQAISWIPLFQLNCHPDTQIFLCSLFTPVCLEHPIPPCRSLCLTVQSSCEDTMSKYGYPWPHIVRCDQFPVDNDMCIMAQHGLAGGVVGLPKGSQANSSNAQPVQVYPDGTPKGRADEKAKKRRKSKKNRKAVSSMTSTSSPVDVTNPSSSTLHVHHHLQTMTEQQETSKELSPPAADESGIHSSSITISDVNRVQVQERILSGYCHSEWSLKVRATATPDPDGSITLHVKSYRVLWGPQTSDMRPSVIIVPANISQEIDPHSAFNTKSIHETTALDKSRFYVMGSKIGHMYMANVAMYWPHKSSQFRKALKDIKNGSVECPVVPSTTTTTASPPHHVHHSRGHKRRRGKERRKFHHHHRQETSDN